MLRYTYLHHLHDGSQLGLQCRIVGEHPLQPGVGRVLATSELAPFMNRLKPYSFGAAYRLARWIPHEVARPCGVTYQVTQKWKAERRADIEQHTGYSLDRQIGCAR